MVVIIKRGVWRLQPRQRGIALENIAEGKFGTALFEKVPGSGDYFYFEVKAIEPVMLYHEIIVVDNNNGITEYYISQDTAVPIAKLDRYSGTDQTYKTVVSWTITSGKRGTLKEVSMITDNYTKTQFKLTIAGTVQFENKYLQSPLTLPFPEDSVLQAEEVVLLQCKSTDGTSIVVDGSITGGEY